MTPSVMVVRRVLVNRDLLRYITVFQQGWPQELLDFYKAHRPRKKAWSKNAKRRVLGELLMRFGNVRLAELSLDTQTRDSCGNWRSALKLNGSYIEAVKYGRVDMLEWGLKHTKPYLVITSYMWQTVFENPPEDPALLDFILTRFRDESIKEIRSRVQPPMFVAEHANEVVLVKWLTETLPTIKLSEGMTEEAAKTGNLALVRYLHEHRASEGCTRHAFHWAAKKRHWDVLEYLLRHRREFYDPFVVQDAIKWDELHVLEAIKAMGFTELLQGHTQTIVEQVRFNNVSALKWYLDNDIFAPESVSIDELVGWWEVFDIVKRIHDCGAARATTEAVENACTAGNWDVVRFLLENRTEGFTQRALLAAEAAQRPEIARLLHANAHLNFSPPSEEDIAPEDEARRKLIALFKVEHRYSNLSVAQQAALNGRVDVLEALNASGVVIISVPVIKAVLQSQDAATIQFWLQHFHDTFWERLETVLLFESFDLWLTLSELYPEEAAVAVPIVIAQAVQVYRLPVLRFVFNVLGKSDLAHVAIDGADRLHHADYSAAVRFIASPQSSAEGELSDPKPSLALLLDPRTPTWAVTAIVTAFEKNEDKFRRVETMTLAVQAVYNLDQSFLELLREVALANAHVADSLCSFEGTRAAAVRKGSLPLLQWLLDNVDVPVEPTLLDEAIFYHQREIAEWLTEHHPEACQAFAEDEKVIIWGCACGFDVDELDWIMATPVVRQFVDFGALACYAVQLGDVPSVKRMHEVCPSAFAEQGALAKWLKPQQLGVARFLETLVGQ